MQAGAAPGMHAAPPACCQAKPLQVSLTSSKQAVRQVAHAVAVCFAWRRSQIDFWAAVDFIGTVVFLVDIVLK